MFALILYVVVPSTIAGAFNGPSFITCNTIANFASIASSTSASGVIAPLMNCVTCVW